MKTVEICDKSLKASFRRKEFVFPSGRVDEVMGYEPFALTKLLETYSEKDIVTNIWCIPTFDYKRVSTKARVLCKEGTISRYFPDIMVPDKIIEVKSTYTYKQDELNVVEKMRACVRAGYKSELWVYKNNKGDIDFKMSFSEGCGNEIVETLI